MIKRFLRSLNSHLFAHIGCTLIAVSGATQLPQVQAGLDLFHDNGKTRATVNAGGVLALAVGTALTYLGRPQTIPSDPPQAPK